MPRPKLFVDHLEFPADERGVAAAIMVAGYNPGSLLKVVTGGGESTRIPSVTYGDEVAEWLKEQLGLATVTR